MISPREARAMLEAARRGDGQAARRARFLNKAADASAYREVKADQKRIDDQPAERSKNSRGCRECYCCKSGNRYGCSRNADASIVQAVFADAAYWESV